MPSQVKVYISIVIGAGCLIMAATLGRFPMTGAAFWTCVAAAIAGAALKLRLPGLAGTYSLTYVPVMYSCVHLTAGETVFIAAIGALAQSYINTRKRPGIVQALFNAANLVVSVWVSHAAAAALAEAGINSSIPSATAVFLACYFAVNTTIVSGVLALLEGKKLKDVCNTWYSWSLPYYLIGASLIGALFPAEGPPHWEGTLITITLLALVQFYAVAREVPRLQQSCTRVTGALNPAARRFALVLCTLAASFFVLGALTVSRADATTFLIYVVATILVSTWKVRLPDFQGTISLNFVLLLVAVTHLTLLEVSALAAIAAVTQCVWRPARKPAMIQVIFSAAALVVSTALAYEGVRMFAGSPDNSSAMAAVILATIILYVANTWSVTMMIGFVQGRAGGDVWVRCQFWTFAFYLVGASAAALITVSARTSGLLPSLLMLPLMYLIWLSYRGHVGASAISST